MSEYKYTLPEGFIPELSTTVRTCINCGGFMKSHEKIILILNQFEAQWLKDVVQNPLNATGNPELESSQDSNVLHTLYNSNNETELRYGVFDAEIRKVFWDELSKYDLL